MRTLGRKRGAWEESEEPEKEARRQGRKGSRRLYSTVSSIVRQSAAFLRGEHNGRNIIRLYDGMCWLCYDRRNTDGRSE